MTTSCSSPSTFKEVQTNKTNDTLVPIMNSFNNSDSIQINQLIKDYNLNRIDTFTIGDVDGDGIKDKAFIQPLTFFFLNNKIDSQYVNITFSCKIPIIKHYNGFGGIVADLGDLDGNKTDEVIYYPDWYQSNNAGIFIYGYSHNTWTLLGSGSIRRNEVSEAKDPIKYLKSRVKKVDNSSFRVSEYIWNGDDLVDSTKIIFIK